ncbi:hypothetical protein [Streptomyces sp. NPDC047985]|uniref:hypothetical protein n=1 Tax=unclassified Streptomyces TaxID=2593676 RepID=UPI00341318C1
MTPLASRSRISGLFGRSGPGGAPLIALSAVYGPALPRTAHAAAPAVPGPGTVDHGGASAVDLIVPLAVLVGTAATAARARVLRRRRAVTRTTPGTSGRRPDAGPRHRCRDRRLPHHP